MSIDSAGGWPAIRYTLSKAGRSGGLRSFLSAMRSPNTCKACALGMGGAAGGMSNELGGRFELCKKSVQAMAADMRGRVPEGFFGRFGARELRAMSSRELEQAGRLTSPILLEPAKEHYREIGWDEAIGRAAKKLSDTDPGDSFFYVSGRSSNEAGFLLQLFARIYGTNNVNNCSYYCHQASGVGLGASIGSGTASIRLADVRGCDTLFLIGANPASNHPRFMKELVSLRRRGGKVVVVNPAREIGLCSFRVPSDWRSLFFGSEIASLYVQPRIGGDIAFFTGIARCVIEAGAADDTFIAEHTSGWKEWWSTIQRSSWEEIVSASGVDETAIRAAAEIYLESRATIFAWAMGITHHIHGVENVQCIASLALMRGMVGRPGAGLLPLRGHSNVQGMGTMAVVPRMKAALIERLERELGEKLPTEKGLDTMGCMERAHAGEMRVAWCLGGNLYGSNPASRFAREAMGAIDQVVYFSTTLNTGHAHGIGKETIVLPVRARDEEEQTTTQESMFSFVRRSAGGPARHPKIRTETAIIVDVARRLFSSDTPVDWEAMGDHDNIRELIAKAIPGFSRLASGEEFHIPGRAIREPSFPTEDGRARFHAIEIPRDNRCTDDELLLMSVRSEGQFNTVVYEEEDLYRHQSRRDVILMNEADIARLDLRHDQKVRVESDHGALPAITVRPFDISPGCALMYYPEANALYPTAVDPRSRTPAYKNVAIRLVPQGSQPNQN
ncbi:MAG: histidine kinase [Gemmatimonadetes bacterium]|nr:histidine kinase [Gemmatimonadota bacterium]